MEQREIMEKLSLTPDSIFTAAQARAAGIHSEYLTNMVKVVSWKKLLMVFMHSRRSCTMNYILYRDVKIRLFIPTRQPCIFMI